MKISYYGTVHQIMTFMCNTVHGPNKQITTATTVLYTAKWPFFTILLDSTVSDEHFPHICLIFKFD